jgi:hypothetical protein
MRKQVAILAAAALSVCTSGFDAAGEGKPPALEARSFAVPGHGSLALPVPAAWKQEVNQPPTDPSPTITFSPASGDDFKVLVTPLWSPTNDPNFNKPQAVRRLIDNETRKMLPSAVEKELAVKEFKGAAGTGYYYLAFRGRWIDVHISIMEPVAGDEKVFAAFDKSLRCGD